MGLAGLIVTQNGCKTSDRNGQAENKPEKRPNIILCMADDQGWGDAAPVCSPTRGSVMTGRHPNRFGCFTWGRGLRVPAIIEWPLLITQNRITDIPAGRMVSDSSRLRLDVGD